MYVQSSFRILINILYNQPKLWESESLLQNVFFVRVQNLFLLTLHFFLTFGNIIWKVETIIYWISKYKLFCKNQHMETITHFLLMNYDIYLASINFFSFYFNWNNITITLGILNYLYFTLKNWEAIKQKCIIFLKIKKKYIRPI